MTVEQQKQSESEWAFLRLSLETKKPEVETLVLATEQSLRARQHKYHFHKASEASIHLPPGKYLIQITALYHRPANLAVQLKPGSEVKRKVVLKTEDEKLPSFEQRLKSYGLKPEQAVKRLELKERQRMCAHNQEGQPGVVRQKAETLKDVKRFIGAPFGVFDHDESRFGAIEVPKETLDHLRKKELIASDHEVLKDLAKEYLHGNERANGKLMADLEPLLNQLVVGDFWFHLYSELTIGAGATYEFGPGTLILDHLRIHKTGKLVPVGQCKFDIGHWEEFT